MAEAKYKLAQDFLRNLLKDCQKKNNYCDHPNKDCSGCNIYRMAKGQDKEIEAYLTKRDGQ